jgi:hypothetical protein
VIDAGVAATSEYVADIDTAYPLGAAAGLGWQR